LSRLHICASVACLCLGVSALVPNATHAKASHDTGHAVTGAIMTMLESMPAGMVTQTGADRSAMSLQVQASGLTPGSTHRVVLAKRGCSQIRSHMRGIVPIGTLQADAGGALNASVLASARQVRSHRSLELLLGTPASGAGASRVVACASLHGRWQDGATPLEAAPASGMAASGSTDLSYDAIRHTLTVHVAASGFAPGSTHAAHIHQGTCARQGGVIYMLPDLVADGNGRIDTTQTLTGVMSAPPASGWYLNIHLGDSQHILANGQPTLYFQPLLCGDIAGMPDSTHGQTTTSGGEHFLAPGETATLMIAGPFTFTASCTTVQSGGQNYNQVAFNVLSSQDNSDLDGAGPVRAGTVVNIHTDSDLIPNPQGTKPATPALPNGTFDQAPSASTSTEIAPDGTEVDVFYNDGVNLNGHACFAGAVALTS
jgi:hypothetical protein